MKTLITLIAVTIFLVALFVALWWSTPSIETLRKLSNKHDRYALVVHDRNGKELSPYFRSESQVQYISLDIVPVHFINYLIFYEDRSFTYNIGFSPTGIIRSILGGPGGGSTITQQTFRLLTSWKERTLIRKAAEIVGAIKLTFALTKEEILEQYINLAYFGGSRNGLVAAAQKYFDKKPEELTKAESIMLISFLNKPPKNIIRNTGIAYKKYQHRVQMLTEAGKLSEIELDYNEIITGPEFDLGSAKRESFSVFLDRVYREYNNLNFPINISNLGGNIIETTMDESLNDSICILLDNELRNLPLGTKGAFLLLNQNNEVLCYVSGLNLRGDFDFIMSEHALPASRFKIPICAVAIDKIMAAQNEQADHIVNMLIPTRFEISPNHIIQDPGPQFITLRDAISESRNAALYWVGNNITTPQEIVEFAKYFDLNLLPYPSLPMGTQPVSEFKLGWIYSTLLVRDGFLKTPTFIRRVLSIEGEDLYNERMNITKEQQIISSTTCKIIRQLLREAEQRGTSSYLAQVDSLESEDISPKTGTTRKFRQLGVTGAINQYTFSLLIQGEKLNQPASKIAVPIVASLLQCMKRNGYF